MPWMSQRHQSMFKKNKKLSGKNVKYMKKKLEIKCRKKGKKRKTNKSI